ncbi:MAG: efflux RND transporter periplasmic adaptor subunit [Longimicrobiales bacterium]
MNISGWWKRAVAIVGMVAVVAAVALFSDGAAEDARSAEPATERTVNVVVETVEPRPFDDVLRLTGTAEARSDVTVAAEESGVIRALYVDRGARVRAGQPIAKIDDALLRAQFEEATANAMLAQETFERQRRLWEDERIGSEMTYLQAKYRAETARAAAKVIQARLERTVVRAAISGVVDDRMVDVGSMVAPGSAVARVIDISAIEVTGGVPERYATEVRTGNRVRITFDVLGSREFTGEIRFVGAALNPENRTIPVEVLVPNPSATIKPGMVASVAIAKSVLDSALVIPREAVLRHEDGYSVYIAADEGGRAIAQLRHVQLGPSESGKIVALAGLAPGDRVIVVGQNQVAEGDVLTIVDRAEALAR